MTTCVVAVTAPNAEYKAATDVRRFGVDTWLPRYFDEKTRSRRLLLPGYLFVMPKSSKTPLGFLSSCDGVSDVIWLEQRSRRRLYGEVKALRKLENAKGLIVLPGQHPTRYTFLNGEPIKVRGRGPMAGLSGTFIHYGARERVKAVFDILGRKTPVWLKVSDIQAENAAA